MSTGGGRYPLWSRDGRELLFLRSNGGVMTAGYTAKGDTFAAEQPRVWTEIHMRTIGVPPYDLAADGKRVGGDSTGCGGGRESAHETDSFSEFRG